MLSANVYYPCFEVRKYFYCLFVSKIIFVGGRKDPIQMENLKKQHYTKSTSPSREKNQITTTPLSRENSCKSNSSLVLNCI